MADFDDLKAQATLAAGKDMARRAVDDLLSSEEEKAQREKEESEAKKSRRTKMIVVGVAALLLVFGIVGLVLSYWQYFILAGLLGLGGAYGYFRVRKRLDAAKDEESEEVAEAPVQARVVEEPELSDAERQEASRRRAAEAAREREVQARAYAEAEAQAAQEVEDELAAMKARMGKR